MIRLITLLVSGIPAIIAAIISFIVRKVGTSAGSLAAFAIVTVAFIAGINTIFQSLLAVVTLPGWVANAVGMFIPANFSMCVASIWSAKTCRALYDMARFKIKMINTAN